MATLVSPPAAVAAAPTVVAAPSITLAPGDSAEALWKMGHKWYSVTVRSGPHADGTYALTYADGDRWDAVPPDRIRTVGSHEPLALAAAVVKLGGGGTGGTGAADPGGGGGTSAGLRHAVALSAVDPAYLDELFPKIKAIFKPQVVKYSNTNPDIAAADGGAHGEKVDWKVSSYMEVR